MQKKEGTGDEPLPLGPESYEQINFWRSGNTMSLRERRRVETTISHLPDDALSILDVGCGDGKFAFLLGSGLHAAERLATRMRT